MNTTQSESKPESKSSAIDRVVLSFQNTAIYSVLIVLGIIPILFIPVWYAPFTYTKTFVLVTVLLVAFILYSLSVLRSGTVAWVTNPLLWALWAIVLAGTVSGLFSGDISDAFIGDTLNVHTVFFMLVLAAVATFVGVFAQLRGTAMHFYFALTVSGVILAVFHLLRLVFSPEFLSLGLFTATTATPIGGWNDLGLFFGLTILLSILALNVLPLTRPGQWLFGGLVVLSLLMLTTINFFSVWIVLALASMVILIYSLAKDRFADSMVPERTTTKDVSVISLVLTLMTFIVSFSFVIAGVSLGSVISNYTGVSYVEVRPSPAATLNVARSVYNENFLLGVGPNKFADAWRLHKDESINQTIFWNTNFSSGSGFIPTQLVTHGIVGVAAWVWFLFTLVYVGFRFFMRIQKTDTLWYFIGISSLVSTLYIWGMALVYTPGVTVLVLGAAFTGMLVAAYAKLFPARGGVYMIQRNKRAAFILVTVVMLIIISSTSILYFLGKHYASVWLFSDAINNISDGTTIESVEAKIVNVYSMYQNDAYAEQLAQYQLSKMNTLLNTEDPTPEQQSQFENSAVTGIEAVRQAIALDPTEPRYYALLGSFYATLAIVGIENANDRALEALAQAKEFDPYNPSYSFMEAQLAFELSDLEQALTKVNEAITQKPNFTNALALLAQIQIANESVDQAIATTRSITTFEPNNPARFYQLGTLQLSAQDIPAAIRSLERAVQLDQNFANARYFLALAYLEQDNTEAALAQLRIVEQFNPDNEGLRSLVERVESGEDITIPNPSATQETINDGEPVIDDSGDAVTTDTTPDTDLITPVNTTGATEDDSAETTPTSSEESN